MNKSKLVAYILTAWLAIEIAGHYLKQALESGDGLGQEMYSLTIAQTLAHLEAVAKEFDSGRVAQGEPARFQREKFARVY